MFIFISSAVLDLQFAACVVQLLEQLSLERIHDLLSAAISAKGM